MIIAISYTVLTPTSNSEGVTTSIDVVTSVYSQEPSPVGDPVNGVQPVEYLDEHIIESDTRLPTVYPQRSGGQAK